MNRFLRWLRPRRRLFSIYLELGYNPWRKPRQPRQRNHKGVYMGAAENIPFLNDDAKRTFAHLLLRPGYMMRDYIQRGQHEHYLAPLTSLLVFYTVLSLVLAVFNPSAAKDTVSGDLLKGLQEAKIESDSIDVNSKGAQAFQAFLNMVGDALLITHLDLHPEAVDAPWKESLAAVEANIRSKGIPLFLETFLLLWFAMAILLRKYKISFSGAAAGSAYVLCQFCVFIFLALLFTGGRVNSLGLTLSAVLLFIDYRQWLGVGTRRALGLTVKTGLWIVLFATVFYLLLGMLLLLLAFSQV